MILVLYVLENNCYIDVVEIEVKQHNTPTLAIVLWYIYLVI